MKNTDLRVGNLLNFTFMGLTEQYAVYEIRQDSVLITKDISYQYSMVSGIPLTEQWLLKLGFEIELGQYRLNPNCVIGAALDWIGVYSEWVDDDNTFNCPKYVHQLQNLYYALTHIELEINKI